MILKFLFDIICYPLLMPDIWKFTLVLNYVNTFEPGVLNRAVKNNVYKNNKVQLQFHSHDLAIINVSF